jgi:dolichol-phosphate mannosyltransferase
MVIPVQNARATIQQALREAEAALGSVASAYEIIVVDDGSCDGTADLVQAAAAVHPHVRLIAHPRPLGHGVALRSGLDAASLDLVAIFSADGRLDPGDLAHLLPLTRHFDVICGYRMDRQDSALRRLLSWTYNTLAGLALPSPVRDVSCALKVFRREQLPALLPECTSAFAGAEMVARAQLDELVVVEVGVRHRPPVAGRSKGSWREAPRTLADFLRFWWSRLLFPGADTPEERSSPADPRWHWAALVLLIVLAGALLFPNLSYPLLEPDEGRYAEIGREMLASGDWVVPTLNQHPYYDKPPLLYWLLAGSYALFSVSEAAARLVPALAALATVLATYLFGRRIVGGRPAFLAALALALTPGAALCGRFLVLDSLLTLCVTVALFAAYFAVDGKRLRWAWWAASAASCALGVLTKGPVALVLIAAPVVAFAWLGRSPARPLARHWAVYGALALGPAVPWFAAILCREPDFAWYFFVEHHLLRFLGQEYHSQPWWYYVPVLLVGGLPWSLLAIPWIRFLFGRSAQLRALRTRSLGFFVLWSGWCVLFFSLSRGKLPPYILPGTPALAMLLGWFLDRALFHPPPGRLFRQARCAVPRLGAVVLAGTGLALSPIGWRLRLFSLEEALLLVGLCIALLVGLVRWGRWLPGRLAWVVCCVLASVMILGTANYLMPAWSAQRSPLARSQAVERLVEDGVDVACYGGEWGSVPFYFGSREMVAVFTPASTAEQVQQFLSAHPRCLFVIRHREDRQAFQNVLPDDAEVTTVADTGEAVAILVEQTPASEAD